MTKLAFHCAKTLGTFLLAAVLATSVAHAAGPTAPYQTWDNSGDGIWGGSDLDWSALGSTSTTGGSAWTNNQSTLISAGPPATYTYSTTAYFSGTPGTVTVDNSSGPTYFGEMDFNATAGTYDFKGDTLEYSQGISHAQLINVMAGDTANVTYENEIEVNTDGPTYNANLGISNSGTNTTLTLGAINVTGPSSDSLVVAGANGTTTIFNGPITSDTINGANTTFLLFGAYGKTSTAVYEINGPLSFTGIAALFNFDSGTLYLGTDVLTSGNMVVIGLGAATAQTDPLMGLYTDKSGLNITNYVYDQVAGNFAIGGSTSGTTTFSGQMALANGGSRVQLNAAAGGITTFSGVVSGANAAYMGTSGAGTIVLSKTTGNTYTVNTTITSDVFEMNSGTTTLIQNTSGSAFGANTGTTVFAQIDAGATLGGSGISTQQIVAAAHTSVIAPGNGTTITQLHLNGGLATTAADGLTMSFDLNGSANDSIDFASAAVILNGPIDVSFANLGSVLTDHVYTLLTGTGDWTGGAPTFNITAPAGYTLDTSYGTDGYDYVTTGGTDSLSVEFEAVPEPSPVLLIALSISGLAFLRWARRLSALKA